MGLGQQTQVELHSSTTASLAFAQRARGTLPYPDSSQWEPSPPLWAPHLPSLAGPHAPHLLSLACPLPWLCSATSMQVSVAHGQGAARGRVFEWAAWEGGQALLSCMGTCAQQLHNHTHNSSPERHVPFQGQTTALPQAPALSLPDNCPTYGQHESPHSFHTQHRGAAEEAEPSSHLQVLTRPFSPSTVTAFQHALRPSLAKLLHITPPPSKGSRIDQEMSSCYFPGQFYHLRGSEIVSRLCLCLWPGFDHEMFSCNSLGIF